MAKKSFSFSYSKSNQFVLVQDESQLTQTNLCLGTDPASHSVLRSRRGLHCGVLLKSRVKNAAPEGPQSSLSFFNVGNINYLHISTLMISANLFGGERLSLSSLVFVLDTSICLVDPGIFRCIIVIYIFYSKAGSLFL